MLNWKRELRVARLQRGWRFNRERELRDGICHGDKESYNNSRILHPGYNQEEDSEILREVSRIREEFLRGRLALY